MAKMAECAVVKEKSFVLPPLPMNIKHVIRFDLGKMMNVFKL